MIKFFRKIRQKLLEQGSFRKYLIYAIGEILLVVIGILIALQINNWNEWRKDRILEEDLLTEFYNGFLIDLENLAEDTLRTLGGIRRTAKLIEALEDPDQLMPVDSLLGAPYTSAIISINTGVYELLKNKGTDLISNNNLRRRLFYFYETELDWYGDLQKSYYDSNRIFESYYSDLVYRESKGSTSYKFKTSRWQEMKSDTRLIEKLNDVIGRRQQELRWMFEFMDKIKMLNRLIKEELERFQS